MRIINFFLFFISVLLLLVFGGLGMSYAILKFIFTLKFKRAGKLLMDFLLTLAISIDQLGNVMMQYILTDFCLKDKKTIHKFGNPDQTISYVIGINYIHCNLTKFGLFIANTLNKLDNEHVIKAVMSEINKSREYIRYKYGI